MIKTIAASLTTQLKDLIELLELNGLTTTERALEYDGFTTKMFSDIKDTYNEWVNLTDELDLKQKKLEYRYLVSAIKGTTAHEFKFEHEPKSKIGHLVLTNVHRANKYKIKIHPF